MAFAAEALIRTAIVNTIVAAAALDTRVWRRWRRPDDGRPESFQQMFCDGEGKVHVWMIRRVQLRPTVTEFGDPTRITHSYAVMGYLSVLDNDDDLFASEEIFQTEIEAISNAFQNNVNLGFDAGVTHLGFAMPADFQDSMLGPVLVHEAKCAITVDVEDC